LLLAGEQTFGFSIFISIFYRRIAARSFYARTYTQAAVNAALNYLMTGGPKGGPLPKERFDYELWEGLFVA